MQKSNRGRKIGLTTVGLLLLAFGLIPGSGCHAQAASSNYQTAEPKMDSSNDMPKLAPSRHSAPLQGSIQHVDKKQHRTGRLMGGARRANQDALRARVKDDGGALKAQAESSIGIVGVKFVATLGKPPVINEVFPNTPADKVGLRVLDMIVAVDGVPTSGLTKDEVFDLIVGTPNTQVTISILRNGDYQVVTCTRMDINELNDPRIRRDYMIHM